ncbi:DNA-directed RNA polymerase III, subunit Rpc31 [Clohesyomyces aquaticus]|uniref:DNA-directed RNA polymerase III subunit n=1 Tax=Clohesyomyces aquaticus TaxID=1231657 RepID=A0A1Y1ZVG0_9PLEO|nr:DNA-directed RNA polymerase III, subunit Rpc31 [Clohesyomyces aquaticus]
MASRGRGGARGGRGGAAPRAPPGTVKIAGVEMAWDLTGLELNKAPTENFPRTGHAPPPPPTSDESATHHRLVTLRDRIHDGPLYTILGDGMETGLKRRQQDAAPTEAALFNPFTDNLTYSAKYMKVRRRIPRLDTRPYVVDLFPEELRSILSHTADGGRETKRQKLLHVSKVDAVSRIDRILEAEEARAKEEQERADADEEVEQDAEDDDAEEEYDEKPDAIDEEDNWSAPSTDSEESDDDYNAERYFDGGEDDYGDEGGGDENTYE